MGAAAAATAKATALARSRSDRSSLWIMGFPPAMLRRTRSVCLLPARIPVDASLRHDFRDAYIVTPILDRFEKKLLGRFRRVDEGIAAEAVEKLFRLIGLH